jgi:death on curing protein
LERFSITLKFPSREDIIEINQEMISRYGGLYLGEDNLKFFGSLDWVLDAIQYPIFGKEIYPTIIEKAAIIGWIICEGHVFHDGNKRTGTMAVLLFLKSNGVILHASKQELLQIAEKLATSKKENFTFEDYISWLENHVT